MEAIRAGRDGRKSYTSLTPTLWTKRAPAPGRRLAALLLAWLAGAALRLQERLLLPWAAYAALAASALLALMAGFEWRRRGRVAVPVACLGALVAGFAVTG